MIRALGYLLVLAASTFSQSLEPFPVEETTIAQVHNAMKAGRFTCRALVDQYLKRIETYDKNGPAINSIILINPNVQKESDELDHHFLRSGLTGSLHCVPLIVKGSVRTGSAAWYGESNG